MRSLFGIITSQPDLVDPALEKMAGALGVAQKMHVVTGPGWGLGVNSPSVGLHLATGEQRALHVAMTGEFFDVTQATRTLPDNGNHAQGIAPAELMFRLCEGHGPEAIMDLNGLFAAAIIDARELSVELLVDPVGGISHLHYANFEDGIVFASELRQILASGLVQAQPDERVVAEFFMHGHSLPPYTFIKGIQKVAPGTIVSFKDGRLATRRIWKPKFDVAEGNDEEHVERFRCALSHSVTSRSADLSEPSAFLSGGLDSSVNVGLLTQANAATVHTFSIAYPEARFDESPYARSVADECHTKHHEMVLDSPEALDELPLMVWHLEEPTMDSSFVPTWNLARFARDTTDTVISGDGPDHLLGRHYPMAVARELLCKFPGSSALAYVADSMPGAWGQLRRSKSGRHLWKTLRAAAPSPIDAYLSIYRDIIWQSRAPRETASLITHELHTRHNGHARGDFINEALHGLSTSEQMITLDLTCNGAFGVFSKVGKMAAAHGLTLREPYLDSEVMRAIFTLPATLRVRGTYRECLLNRATKKYVLRKIAEGLVPEKVLSKPKHGFEAPISIWLRDWLAGLTVQELLPNLTASWIRAPFAQRLVEEHVIQARDHGYLLLMLITMELWVQIFLHEGGQKPTYSWRDYIGSIRP